MARVAIPILVVQANSLDDGADPIELAALGIDVDAALDHTLGNAQGKTVLLAILDASTKAKGTLSIPTNPTATDTMTIGIGVGSKVYTFRATADFDANGEVEILGTAALTRASIVAAINGTDAFNTAHTQVTAALGSGNDIIITAIDAGITATNVITTETFTAGGNIFDAGTLGTTVEGGTGPAVTITIAGVDDPYGRGASPDGDLVLALSGPGVYCLGRFSPAMFNQGGADQRKVYVNAASVTAATAVHLVALSF